MPVSATVEGVIGAIDLERSAATGRRALRAGLLARAHRGILYVDEVNLLNDQLADVLLDAAAMGQNHVERDGISISHPARFMLIGTMNPEEGNLRPQLLDRFGLIVDAESLPNPADRAEVVRRRTAFEADPEAFIDAWSPADRALRDRVESARLRVPSVAVSDATVEQIATVCARFQVDGMRADLAMFRAAVARAALDGRTEVAPEDVRTAAYLALPHRRTSHVSLQLEEDLRHLDGVVASLLGPAPAAQNGAHPLDSLTLTAPR
jgi:magnesium chelatase subunit D